MSMQIKCKNIRLEYDRIPVVENLSFSVAHGDFLCIVGSNGSGKSTLVKALLGLKKVSGGTIECTLGKNGRIGYLPQQHDSKRDFPASVFEIVLSGCLNDRGFRPFYYLKSDKKRAESIMKSLGIYGMKNRSFRELSGGQQQRVLLCRAVGAADELIILDEPVAGLDPVATAEMYDTVKRINKQGMTVIMVSHDLSAAVTLASHILHLSDDKYFFGTTDEYLKSGLLDKLSGEKTGGKRL